MFTLDWILVLGNNQSFDDGIKSRPPAHSVSWINAQGKPLPITGGTAVNDHLADLVHLVQAGEAIGDVDELAFRDPNTFRAANYINTSLLGKW